MQAGLFNGDTAKGATQLGVEIAQEVQDWSNNPDEQLDELRDWGLTISPSQIGSVTVDVALGIVLTKGTPVALARAKRLSNMAKRAPRVEVENRQLQHRIAQLESALEEAQKLAITDPLSGSLNRAAIVPGTKIRMAIDDLLASDLPNSIIYWDGDYFKAINDFVGHAGGDDVIRLYGEMATSTLREFDRIDEATTLLGTLRKSDLVFRAGAGEEFFLFLPNTTKEQAARVALRLQDKIRTHERMQTIRAMIAERATDPSNAEKVMAAFRRSNGVYPQSGNVGTATVGIAEFRKGETLENLIHVADLAVGEAKNVFKSGQAMGFREILPSGESTLMALDRTSVQRYLIK
jgi:GGDEF domain-containing protein